MFQPQTDLTRAKGVGDRAADFRLTNHLGDTVQLDELRRRGPVVLSFYRGGWCEHCSGELQALADMMPDIAELGASVVALGPEVPQRSRATRECMDLPFDVLSDLSNVVARRFGLVYRLNGELLPIYQRFGIDLVEHNGDDSYELPVPATYVIDRFGLIRFAFVNQDHRQRAAAATVLAALRKLS